MLVIFLLVSALAITSGVRFAAAEKVGLMQLEEVTDLLMSPGCNYQYTLSYCPSTEADQMRELVRDKIAVGESTEQILDYFHEIYGPKVLAQPIKSGFYFAAWWFPYFLLLDLFMLGWVILFVWKKKYGLMNGGGESAESDLNLEQEMTDLLEDEVRKFRDG